MSDEGRVRVERDGAIVIVTFDRPHKHNSLTPVMWDALFAAVDDYGANDALRALILTGAGDRAFCAGADLESAIPAMLDRGHTKADGPDPSTRFFSTVTKPIIAAVNGLCVAGGMEMLLGTDLRLAVPHAQFGLSEVRWGLVPSGGSHIRLPRQVPWAIAMEMVLLGESVPAQRAHDVGLINRIVPPESLLNEALRMAALLASHSALAVRTAKEIAMRGLALEDAFRMESALAAPVLASPEARASAEAFRARPRAAGGAPAAGTST